jgi:CheY-like chemotaxis protein
MITQRDGSANDGVGTDDDTLRIVCVDDEPGLAEAVSTALEHVDDGIRATATTCPKEALQLVEGDQPDCIVSDYEMPERDGAWLCDRVSEHDVPFVLYTSRSESSLDLDDPQLDGVTAVVRKDRGMSHYADLAEHVRRSVAVESGL